MKKLINVSLMCLIFMFVEFFGGIFAGSLAIMTDAAHLLSDGSGFLISICAIWVSKKSKKTPTFTYGYARAEILGAFASIALIWFLTLWLLFEAVERVLHPEEVNGKVMVITASFGLLINIVMAKVLHSPLNKHHNCSHGHSHGHDHL